MATVKKYQNSGKPLKATPDSSAYYKKKADSLNISSGLKYSKGDFKGGKKDSDKSLRALYDEYRQSEKGRPGKDASGFPLKKNKTGGVTKAKGGKWIQKATASIKRRGTEGKCTPITKPGCTGRAKALAKTFKKIAAKRKGK